MPSVLNDIMGFITSPTFGAFQFIALAYVGLLWLSIIIWVTRDSIHRSSNLIFQTFSILINIAVPILGVLLYLIIRPAKTNMEKYYEELEHRLITEESGDSSCACEKCMTIIGKDYTFCPNCGSKVKKSCTKCKKTFPSIWDLCPYCGVENKETKPKAKAKAKAKAKVKAKNITIKK